MSDERKPDDEAAPFTWSDVHGFIGIDIAHPGDLTTYVTLRYNDETKRYEPYDTEAWKRQYVDDMSKWVAKITDWPTED